MPHSQIAPLGLFLGGLSPAMLISFGSSLGLAMRRVFSTAALKSVKGFEVIGVSGAVHPRQKLKAVMSCHKHSHKRSCKCIRRVHDVLRLMRDYGRHPHTGATQRQNNALKDTGLNI